jgi:hypothetical protein
MRVPVLLSIALLAGCGRTSPGVNDDNVTTELLERVSKQRNVVEDVGATARLQPLGLMGLIGNAGSRCRFTRDNLLVFISSGQAGAARINGTTRNLRAEGPVGSTGGFFREGEIGISVGVERGEAARVVVTNRLTEAREEVTGNWSCEGN